MILFKLPFPSMKELAPNRRGHWSKFEAARKNARHTGWITALEAKKRSVFVVGVKVEIYFFQPDFRRRDDDGMIGAFKSYRDGIADAIKVDDAHWKTSYFFPEKREKGGSVIVKIYNPEAKIGDILHGQ